MDEMEKNELEKNEELEPKEAVETKEEKTQEEASVTDAPAAEEAVETAEEPVTAEASVEETAEEPEIEETEELKQEEAKQEEQPAEAPAAQKAEKGGVLGIVIGLIALIAIVAYAWMNPMGKAVDTGILYTKDDNLYYYDLKNAPYQVQEGLSNGGTYHYFYTAWGASMAAICISPMMWMKTVHLCCIAGMRKMRMQRRRRLIRMFTITWQARMARWSLI